MTASVTSKQFNNFEDMLSVVKETAEKTDATINKAAKDFEKVFDKSVEKVKKTEQKVNYTEEKANNTDKVLGNRENTTIERNTIVEGINNLKQDTSIEKKYNDVVEDIKKIVEQCADVDLKSVLKDKISSILSNVELSEQWSDIRDALSEIVSEANIEASLDLTLAKDINEIISQLKEAVEKTAQSLDDIENKLQPVVDLNQLEDVNASTLNVVVNNSSEAESDLSGEESENNYVDSQSKIATNVPFEQVLTLYDKSVKSEIVNNEKSFELNNNLVDAKELEQTEIIEFVENVAEDLTADKSNENVVSNDIDSLIDEEMLKDLKIENIQAETDTAGGETLMQRQAPEEVAMKNMINKDVEVFDLKLEHTNSSQTVTPTPAKTVDVNPSRILEQITRQMEGLQSGSKVNIVLNPESLGKVNIQLLSTKEGLMAQLTVTTQEAKDILMKGLDGLKDSLLAQGVGVDNVSVKVADAQKSEYNQDWTEQEGSRGGNKGQKNPDRDEKEKGAFEKMMAKTLEKENGNV